MLIRRLGWISLLLAVLLPTARPAERCTLRTFTVPVTMDDMKPLVAATINGERARFIVDTGAFFQSVSAAAAAQFNLHVGPAPFGLFVMGIGGTTAPQVATVKSFTVGGVPMHDVQFLVIGNDGPPGVAGFLGENLFRIADLELDLANGVLRFVRPQHCGRSPLAYWATAEPVAMVDLHWTSERRPHLIGEATLNGRTIHVLFDTGAARSVLSWRAAKRAGISPGEPGVVRIGAITGIGRQPVAVWSAPVDMLEIGGEKIEHTRVIVGDIELPPQLGADMLLGADFFLAHHVYIANSQSKLYFTYNGGPVFNLSAPKTAQGAPAPVAPAAPASAGVGAPVDSAGYLRRGTAHASRREFTQAIADLTRACELAPKDADCRYQRGLVYWHSGQPTLALADFDAAVALDPRDFDARLARAQLELRQRPAAVEDDLDAADRLAPPQSNLRLTLGRLYDQIGEYAGGVHQFDLWIDYHGDDVRLPIALTDRCGSEAAANVDLDRALDDCNRALRMIRKAASIEAFAMAMSDRGLVYLRQGKLESALADFNAALKLQPDAALARYGRGLVEIRKGLAAEGQADIAASQDRLPGLAKQLAPIGLRP
jgi:predicted aspartyl protease/tetratricopeptide (TPR) repeat protein